jgi:hypothetical protein
VTCSTLRLPLAAKVSVPPRGPNRSAMGRTPTERRIRRAMFSSMEPVSQKQPVYWNGFQFSYRPFSSRQGACSFAIFLNIPSDISS